MAAAAPLDHALVERLEERLGAARARSRLAIELEHDAHALKFWQSRATHMEEWYRAPGLIRLALRLVGMLERARRSALDIRIVENELPIDGLDTAFDGFTLLHLSDLHVDINDEFLHVLIERVRDVEYDLCVLTGDYRAKTYGPIDATLDGMRRLRAHIDAPIYGVLGNHDSIRMVPDLRGDGDRDARQRIDNDSARRRVRFRSRGSTTRTFSRSMTSRWLPPTCHALLPSILLSHTPEVYRQAAEAGFDVLLCGHTHGGQICLPGGYPVTLDARIPRRFGRGLWRHGQMLGYTSPGAGTSIVDVRINCPPEITLHRLRCG